LPAQRRPHHWELRNPGAHRTTTKNAVFHRPIYRPKDLTSLFLALSYCFFFFAALLSVVGTGGGTR
jgi:hypothetical protein